MIVGIMQPYFFPYFGYFDHISRCDKWVVFDISQYKPRSWLNRNRILNPDKGWVYITGNVKKFSRNERICDIRLSSPDDTLRTIINKTMHYKKHAPHYEEVTKLIWKSFNNAASDYLVDINISCIASICSYLEITFEPIIASKADFNLPEIMYPGQWALEIATFLCADTYLNTPGGREIFRPEDFSDRNISLAFTRSPDFRYSCASYKFQPKLSILDVLFWNSKKEIQAQLGLLPIDYASPSSS